MKPLNYWFSNPYTEGNTVPVPSPKYEEWNAPVHPLAGSWERVYERWPHWWRYFNGLVPGPKPYEPIRRADI